MDRGAENKLIEEVGYIRGTVEGISRNIDNFLSTHERIHQDVEMRLRSVEDYQKEQKGITKGTKWFLGAIGGFTIFVIEKLFKFFF